MNIRIQTNTPTRPLAAKRYALIATISLSIAGCVTAPLKTQQQRERLAEAVGFEPGEIAFMNYCFFEEVQEPDSEKKLKGLRGIVAMTDSELCLIDGVLRKAPKSYFLKIPLSEIEGVNSSYSQIQIKHQGRLFVLFVYNWNDLHPDYNLTNELYGSLIFANVPQFETSNYYSWSRLGSPSNPRPINNQQDLPPTNYEAMNEAREQSIRTQ